MQRATSPRIPRRYCHKTEPCADKLIENGRQPGEYAIYCMADHACPWRGHIPVRRRLKDPGPKRGPDGGGSSSLSAAPALPGPSIASQTPGNSRAHLGRSGSQFRTVDICLKCGYVREGLERTCPKCGGAIAAKVVKRPHVSDSRHRIIRWTHRAKVVKD